VNPVTPALATTAGPAVTLGQPVTDTATLSGTANKPGTPDVINPSTAGGPAGGTITFKLYGPSDTGCGPLVYTSPTVTVSGNGPYSTPTPSFTPTAAGTYHWVADYSGDLPNTNAASHNAPDPNTPDSGCTDSNEDVVVNQQNATVSSTQEWLPNDTATVNHGGSVRFTLLKNATVTDAHTCSGGSVIHSETTNLVDAGSGSFTATTSNTTNKVTSVTANDTYTWKIEVPANGSFKAVTSCVEATQFNSLDNGGTVTSQ
jgi:hypothetical protein